MGETPVFRNMNTINYREKQGDNWNNDAWNYFLINFPGPGQEKSITNMAKAMKTDVYYYELSGKAFEEKITVSGFSCRLGYDGRSNLILHVNNLNDYPHIRWGNYS